MGACKSASDTVKAKKVDKPQKPLIAPDGIYCKDIDDLEYLQRINSVCVPLEQFLTVKHEGHYICRADAVDAVQLA